MKLLSHVWLFVNSWTVVRQDPLSMGFSKQEYWRGLPFPTPGDFPDPGIESPSPVAPALQADSFQVSYQGIPLYLLSVQSLSHVRLFMNPWTAAHQTSLSITNSWSLFKLISIESVMPSNHLMLCHPLLWLSSIFPSIRVFSSDSVLRIRWSKYWSFSFSISPSNEYSGLISFRMDW